MNSSGETSVIEVSDSNSTTFPSQGSKRTKRGSNIYTTKFRGVVPHQNGHWGCQIYCNHQRIWLGTFKSEKDAAMAYDSAALKLRSGDCRRNFPFTSVTIEEPNFQSSYSTEAVLNMIKGSTYQSKFADFIRTRLQNVETELSLKPIDSQSNRRLICKQLFQKELTPSDVGKLNRLVIPKKFAIKFFSCISEDVKGNAVGVNKMNDEQLSFYDKSMKLWKFRYCYWKSSQSYVFTRGWNRFVKEKQLKSNDTIVFCLCECWENSKVTHMHYMIDTNNAEKSISLLGFQNVTRGLELQLHLGKRATGDFVANNIERDGLMEAKPGNDNAGRKSFRLFGSQII